MEKIPVPKNITITSISPDDWQVLRDLKINSLEQEPLAFEDQREGKEKYVARTEEEWRARLNPDSKDKFWLFAKDEDSDQYLGTIFVHVENREETIQHVFVDNQYREQGIGKKLLSSLLEKLKTEGAVDSVYIQVLVTQEPAISMYHRFGFKDVKTITGGAKRGETAYDEIEMRLEF